MISFFHSLISGLQAYKRSLSTKLSLGIILMAMPIFALSLGLLFIHSRYIIRNEAVERANSVLSAAMQRVCRNIITIETATNANSWLVPLYLQPDSILAFTNRIVRLNPHIDGCSISTEPDIFPEYGKYFSAYSIRSKESASGADTIITVVEEQYNYFAKAWYKLPHDLNKPCWVDFYDETDSLEVALKGMIASFSKPIYDDSGCLIAIISTDLSLLRLSKAIAKDMPYPNSYFMMVDKDGRYFIHPDSTKLFLQTIFNDIDPRQQADIVALGHEMTAGNQGNMSVSMDGENCLVCYQPVPGTSWSIAIVCKDSDVMVGYNQLIFIVVPLLLFGLLAIGVLCHRAVAHAIRPLHQLLSKTQSIADGNMEVHIPKSERDDIVGRLQNSFATMLQSLNFNMGSVRYTTEQAKLRNEELERATRLAEEADRQKTAFIQNVSHQIRTPLNIVMGFAQVLGDAATNKSNGELSEEEVKRIADTMEYNSKLLSRLVTMLFDSSDTGLSEELNSNKHDKVSCNNVVREAIDYIKIHYPNINIEFQTDVADDFNITTNHFYLMRSLREILYNSARYSDGQHVHIKVSLTTSPTPLIQFTIEDTGKGIPEEDREKMFNFFTKVDDLSEGLGLGLPLAKRHANNLGGRLKLDESYHDGCRFILEIPIS